jgi:hypothetical protein
LFGREINKMWGKWKHQYRASYIDSLSQPTIHNTKIDSVSEMSQAEAEELIIEQLNENDLYPKWVKVVEMSKI